MDQGHNKHTREIKYVHDMLFVDPEKPIPGTNLYINRKPHPYIPDPLTDDDLIRREDELIQKGKGRALERGFQTQDVQGQGIESLYRAVSQGLTGSEEHYKQLYHMGILQMSLSGFPPSQYDMTPNFFDKYVIGEDISGLHFVNPLCVLNALATRLSAKIVLFNAIGNTYLGQELTPDIVGTPVKIERTAYVVCFPTVGRILSGFAFAAEPVPPLLKEDLPNHLTDPIRATRIWKQNTIPESPFSRPADMEKKRIKKILKRPGIFDFRCLYDDNDKVGWVTPPRV